MTQLEKLKLMIPELSGTTDQDEALQLLLDDVLSDLLTWTNRTTLPAALEPTQRQIAVIRFNMQGIEGQTSHGEGGVSRSFDELPLPIRQTIGQYRLVKLVRLNAAT
ncbi:phage head-tail connector protein [Paenibacillus thailandensis]|uniref:Phage head-tail connector protein n=1 Tax=Paenibacillus thailandensis TaxID=393250 RepID=A0ABW5QTM7_9BACL